MTLAVVAIIIALLHIYIFLMESVLWSRPQTRKVYGLSKEDSQILKLMAFNQGFYNLFLSFAILGGYVLIVAFDRAAEGRILVDYGVASVLGAGITLFFSAPHIRRAALIQAGPAVVYFALRFCCYN